VVDAIPGAAVDIAYAGQPFGLESEASAECGDRVRWWLAVLSLKAARRFIDALRCVPWVIDARLERKA